MNLAEDLRAVLADMKDAMPAPQQTMELAVFADEWVHRVGVPTSTDLVAFFLAGRELAARTMEVDLDSL